MTKGIDATIELGGVTDAKEFVNMVKTGLETSMQALFKVPLEAVVVTNYCGATCTWSRPESRACRADCLDHISKTTSQPPCVLC